MGVLLFGAVDQLALQVAQRCEQRDGPVPDVVVRLRLDVSSAQRQSWLRALHRLGIASSRRSTTPATSRAGPDSELLLAMTLKVRMCPWPSVSRSDVLGRAASSIRRLAETAGPGVPEAFVSDLSALTPYC